MKCLPLSLLHTWLPSDHCSQACVVAVDDGLLPVAEVLTLFVDEFHGIVEAPVPHGDRPHGAGLIVSEDVEFLQGFLHRGEPVTADAVGGALGGEGADGSQGLPAAGLVFLEGLEAIPDLSQVLGSVAIRLARLLGLGLPVSPVSSEGTVHGGVLPHVAWGGGRGGGPPTIHTRLKLHSSCYIVCVTDFLLNICSIFTHSQVEQKKYSHFIFSCLHFYHFVTRPAPKSK